MRNILLWDQILRQLSSGAYGPEVVYKESWLEVAAAAAAEPVDLGFPLRADQDPFLDLNVSWTELEHNLSLMADDGVITARFEGRMVRDVRLTEKGQRLFEMRNEGERYSRPVAHVTRGLSANLSRFAAPAVGVVIVVWMVLDSI